MTIHKIKLAALCALSALTACRTAHVGSSDGDGTLSAEVQYCFSSGNAGDETVEVLVRNGTRSSVEFVRAAVFILLGVKSLGSICLLRPDRPRKSRRKKAEQN